jgi:hypothetical protein
MKNTIKGNFVGFTNGDPTITNNKELTSKHFENKKMENINNKQQTAVEQLINHLMEYGFDLSLHKMEIEHFKEIQKDQHIKSWEAGLMKVDFNEYYNETYGDDKQ